MASTGGNGYTGGMANPEPLQTSSPPATPEARPLANLEFTGCKPVLMTEKEVLNFEGRLAEGEGATQDAVALGIIVERLRSQKLINGPAAS